ncbi:MAG TPA: serine hydrolase domain-containing protein [Pirellulaceae bacterium]|nr:serine hydrolase domain-containing protein [Pirellulaceae bacterium]
MKITRREYLTLALATSCYAALPAVAEETPALPSTGAKVAELASFDDWMWKFLQDNSVPGGQLAIARGDKLLYSRGFGYADRELKEPVEPTSLFRIASISKSITAVAILKLVERGELQLSDTIDGLLKIEPHLAADTKADARWPEITVAHCLMHTAGWDRDASFDPMFHQVPTAAALGVKLPIGTAELIRFMRGQPLDFAPGEHYAYSNFGYCLLGRVIEKQTGQTYETFVREQILAPLGITAPIMGKSLADERAKGEVKYYTFGDRQAMPIVGPRAGDPEAKVPISYGGWQQEALDSHGGWIASAADLVRFAGALDEAADSTTKPLLSPATIKEMFAPHAIIRAADKAGRGQIAYGYGWVLGTEDHDLAKPIRAHGGALPCTAASLVKLHDGLQLAVLFNLGQNKGGKFLGAGLDGQLIALARRVDFTQLK